MTSAPRVLVIRRRYLGDIVLLGPVFRNLRLHWPGAHLAAVAEPAFAPLLALNPDVNETFVLPRRLGEWPGFLLRLRRAGFTHVLDLDNTERTALITRATGAPCRVAIWYVRHAWPWVYTAALQSQPAEHERRSIIEYYLSALGPAGVPVTSREVRLVPREADLVSARLLVRNAGRKILLHPGSRSAFRMWPAANFAAVCDRVQDELGAQVFVLGGPGEQDTVNAIRAAAKSHLVTINTALGHIDQLATLSQALENGGFTPTNKAWNTLRTLFGSDKVTNFAGSLNFVYLHGVWFAIWIMPHFSRMIGIVATHTIYSVYRKATGIACHGQRNLYWRINHKC
mgnify:CR=1 FL=1